MEPYDLLEVGHHPVKEEWRSVTTTSGALSVMTHGAVWMLALLASILATAMKVRWPLLNSLSNIYHSYYLWLLIVGATGQRNARYGEGTGPILLDQVMCTGNETSLFDCPQNPIGQHNCFHSEDAGVTCTSREFYMTMNEHLWSSRAA